MAVLKIKNETTGEWEGIPAIVGPPGGVNSINGHQGDVVLDAEDVGALPDSYTPPVQSVNGQTGAVVLDAEDVGALPDSYVPPVQSVNSKTGAVELTASDVEAVPSDYIRTFTHTASQTRTYNVPSGSGHLVATTGPGSGQKGMYIVHSTNAGAITISAILVGTDITITSSANNTLSITNGLNSSQSYTTFIRLRGGVVTAS